MNKIIVDEDDIAGDNTNKNNSDQSYMERREKLEMLKCCLIKFTMCIPLFFYLIDRIRKGWTLVNVAMLVSQSVSLWFCQYHQETFPGEKSLCRHSLYLG